MRVNTMRGLTILLTASPDNMQRARHKPAMPGDRRQEEGIWRTAGQGMHSTLFRKVYVPGGSMYVYVYVYVYPTKRECLKTCFNLDMQCRHAVRDQPVATLGPLPLQNISHSGGGRTGRLGGL